jgi:hypothetical protein
MLFGLASPLTVANPPIPGEKDAPHSKAASRCVQRIVQQSAHVRGNMCKAAPKLHGFGPDPGVADQRGAYLLAKL